MNCLKTRSVQSLLHFSAVGLIVLLAFTSSHVSAQTVNGAFHGTVTDPTGALVPGAKVVVTSLSHAQVRESTTDARGFYSITEFPPGHYSVAASAPGFATVTQPDVELLVNQDLELNYQLQVGRVEQLVEVTAAATMLQTTTSTMGQVIGSAQVEDLPLNGRQFTQLILLVPGAAPKETGQQTGQILSIGGGGISPSMNGQQGNQNNFTLDGVYNNQYFTQGWNVSPPPDAIQEFNAQYHAVDARFGMAPGGNINIVTKTGTPQIHGDVWEFLRNDVFDAANFFTNLSNEKKTAYKQNQFGGTIGGPVILPGYDGRKKHTYFYGYYEGFRAHTGETTFDNVPTPDEMGGNFSDLLTTTPVTSAAGQALTDPLGRPMIQGTMYNPYSTRQVAAGEPDPVTGLMAQSTGLVRDPFPGNIIPPSMLNKTALLYLNAFYPLPNYGPGGNSFPNYVTNAPYSLPTEQWGTSLDHTFSNNDFLSGKFNYAQADELQPNGLKIGFNYGHNHGRTGSVNYTHLFSPTSLISVRFAHIWSWFGWPVTTGGSTLQQELNQVSFLPVQDGLAYVSSTAINPRLTGTNQFGNALGPMRSNEFNLDLQKVHGNHNFSIGLMILRTHSFDNGWGANTNFNQLPTSGISADGTNQFTTGDGLASMLLDLPNELYMFYGNTSADIKTTYWGQYGQDKWQASRKLSVTIGYRWDFQQPPHYLNNQFAVWNSTCSGPGPIPAGATVPQATIDIYDESCLLLSLPYDTTPTAAIPNPPVWKTANARPSIWDPRWNGWQGRLGFAYAAKPGIVLRTGFAMFDDHNMFQQEMQDSRGSWPWGGTTEIGPLLNAGVPNTFFDALPSATSLLNSPIVLVGRAGNPEEKIPMVMEYNFGVEYQIRPNTALNVDYVGSVSHHLWGAYGYNAPYPSAMGPNAIPNGEPLPFLGPAFQADDNMFNANYNSLQVKLQKRYSYGLNMLVSYTYSKCLDVAEGMWEEWPQNTYDMEADYGPCDFNFPHLFSFSGIYELPFGNGKHFASGVGSALNTLIGGWNLSNVTSIHSGSDFTVAPSYDVANTGTSERASQVPGCQLKPAGFKQSWSEWLNAQCFVNPPEYTFGNLGRNTMRAEDYIGSDIALYKDFKLTESKRLQFRWEAFNAFNRVNLSPPGGSATGFAADLGGAQATTVSTPTFMQIFSAAPPRVMQFALKLYF